jgi:hypothetical protein
MRRKPESDIYNESGPAPVGRAVDRNARRTDGHWIACSSSLETKDAAIVASHIYLGKSLFRT